MTTCYNQETPGDHVGVHMCLCTTCASTASKSDVYGAETTRFQPHHLTGKDFRMQSSTEYNDKYYEMRSGTARRLKDDRGFPTNDHYPKIGFSKPITPNCLTKSPYSLRSYGIPRHHTSRGRCSAATHFTLILTRNGNRSPRVHLNHRALLQKRQILMRERHTQRISRISPNLSNRGESRSTGRINTPSVTCATQRDLVPSRQEKRMSKW